MTIITKKANLKNLIISKKLLEFQLKEKKRGVKRHYSPGAVLYEKSNARKKRKKSKQRKLTQNTKTEVQSKNASKKNIARQAILIENKTEAHSLESRDCFCNECQAKFWKDQ